MPSVIATAYLLMLTAGPILKVIRVSGAEILSRVMGMILAAVAVENIISAIVELIKTTTL
jgi:multiple antibiotic resistance protein